MWNVDPPLADLTFPCGAMVARHPVKMKVVGSSPPRGAYKKLEPCGSDFIYTRKDEKFTPKNLSPNLFGESDRRVLTKKYMKKKEEVYEK